MRCATKGRLVVLAALSAIASASGPSSANAQASATQGRLLALQQQSAYQRQQSSIQLAVQQTNVLLQSAVRQNSATAQTDLFRPINFQQQQSALQMALQQTNALRQIQMRSSGPSGQNALLQAAAIQSALQTTASLRTALQIQNGILTTDQVQSLFREQASLMSLLASPSPQPSRPLPGR